MTSISAASSSTYQSPLQKLQQELQADIANGTVSSDDQDSLSSALTDIDGSLQTGASKSSATSSGDVKSKIDDLISTQVSSGKLTADQATELKSVFQQAFASGGAGPTGGHGGPGGAGGPPPGPPPSDSSTDSSDSSTDASDVLQQFIDSLKDSQAASASSYGASGTSATSSASSSFSALLIDYTT